MLSAQWAVHRPCNGRGLIMLWLYPSLQVVWVFFRNQCGHVQGRDRGCDLDDVGWYIPHPPYADSPHLLL